MQQRVEHHLVSANLWAQNCLEGQTQSNQKANQELEQKQVKLKRLTSFRRSHNSANFWKREIQKRE